MITQKRPNILFILTDDQRFDTIQALGNPQIKTPNLDKLVECGTSFTNAHIPSGTVGAVCMPSRAMLHTGRTLYHLNGNGEDISREHKMMPEAFAENGYNTFGTGKWHNGTTSFARSFNSGGDVFFGGAWDHWNVPIHEFDPTGKYEKRAPACIGQFYSKVLQIKIATKINLGVHSTELFGQNVIDFVDSQDESKPFLAYLSFLAPHDPRTMPEEFQNMYKAEDMELPVNFAGMHFDYGVHNMRDERLAEYPRDAMEIKQHIADYYAMISHLDYKVGQIIEKLKEKNLYENTIIVFAADNGLSIGQHGLMGKQNCYDHSIRIPLIMAGPGIPKNAKCGQFVYLLDVFPTLCSLTGIETPDSVEGIDFSPMFKDSAYKIRDSIYAGYSDKIRSVKKDGYKLIEYRYEEAKIPSFEVNKDSALAIKNKKVTQLFHIENDPYETVNLADKKEYKEKVEELRQLMKQYRDEWDEMDHPIAKKFWERY